MTKQVSIQRVDNGYIVRVTRQGGSVFKMRYEAPTMVFLTLQMAYAYLQTFFDEFPPEPEPPMSRGPF